MPKYITDGFKSLERKHKNGEVFTPGWMVKKMCDLVPPKTWDDITKTFLEPACGTGNFLVEIFARKLERCNGKEDALVALGSIYGMDIMQDNVDDSRQRLKEMFVDRYGFSEDVDAILKRNIVCHNFLADIPMGWDEFEWHDSEYWDFETGQIKRGGKKKR